MSKFRPLDAYREDTGYRLLPFSFDNLDSRRIVLTNMVGEHLVVDRGTLESLVSGTLPVDHAAFADLRSRHMLAFSADTVSEELLELKVRTRTRYLASFTGLHVFVVTLRCDHSCPYCQVSRRQDSDSSKFDMTWDIASRALDLMFRSPNPALKLEFQGGEPLLNFELVRRITLEARTRAGTLGKNLQVVVATTLSLATDEMLRFFRECDVYLSTSLDGPADLHNANRPRPGRDSYEKFVDGLRRARDIVGRDHVSSLMTTTEASLGRVKDIIDKYVALGFHSIALRPLSPYGFAVKTGKYAAYNTQRFLDFYFEGLDYIVSLNRSGIPLRENYAATILQKILTDQEPGYVDLMNPAGAGIAAIVYDYDGSVYASDESRMLAQMGKKDFCLGDVRENSYEEIMLDDRLLEALESSFTLSVPQCCESLSVALIRCSTLH